MDFSVDNTIWEATVFFTDNEEGFSTSLTGTWTNVGTEIAGMSGVHHVRMDPIA